MISEFDIGHVILMRKPHACGSAEWTVTRTGADVKIKCSGCGRIIMLDRLDFIKKAKKNLTLELQKKAGEHPCAKQAVQKEATQYE